MRKTFKLKKTRILTPPTKNKIHTNVVKTWGDIKKQIEDYGIQDNDPIFMIDIGPNNDTIVISKDFSGVEIADSEALLEGNGEDAELLVN